MFTIKKTLSIFRYETNRFGINFLILFLIFFFNFTKTLKIERAILATDNNTMYIDFWPIVAKAWKKIGVKPTLALVAPENVNVDESFGEVIRFIPLKEVPTSEQAQVLRLLLPIYFEDEGCITSDMDMLPISKEFFIDSVKQYPDDSFIVYRDNAYHPQSRFPICYVAGKGKTFMEIFGIKDKDDIPRIMKKWHSFKYGWHTDEKILYRKVISWKKFETNCIKLGRKEINRIDRANHLKYKKNLISKNYYIDAHLLRPYKNYKKEIDQLAKDLNIE